MNQDRARDPKGCARGCVILLAVLAALIFSGFLAVRHWVRRGMTPTERAEMETFFEEPIEIPKEWQEAYPFPDSLVSAAAAAHAAYVADGGIDWWEPCWRLQKGKELEPEEWKAIEEAVDWYRPYTQALTDLLNLPDYEFEVVTSAGDWLQPQSAAKLLSLQSYLRARDGNWSKAFEPTLTALRIGRRHPGSGVIIHLIAFACEGITCRCIAQLAPACDDPEALANLLEEMSRLDQEINLDVFDDPFLVYIVGELREHARAGHPVDLSSKAPRAYFFRQMIDLRLLTGVPVGTSGSHDPWHLKALARAAGYSRTAVERLYSTHSRYTDGVGFREQTAKSLFDLARLAAAARLYELETGQPVQSATDLLPNYLPEPLLDPFSKKEYIRSKEMNVFYSVGPDKTDHRAAVLYDPSNGTLSRGDIVIGLTQPASRTLGPDSGKRDRENN